MARDPRRRSHPAPPLYHGAGGDTTGYSPSQVAELVATKADSHNAILTGTPVAPTAPEGDDSVHVATTEFVQRELAGHDHDDRYFTEDETNTLLAAKAPLESPALTGTPTAPTPALGNDSALVATTAFVAAAIAAAGTGGGGGGARAAVSFDAGLISSGGQSRTFVTLAGTFLLLHVDTTRACRVRLYSSAAAREADATRAIGTDPSGEHGVICDLVFTADNLGLTLAPQPMGASADGGGSIAITVDNTSGVDGEVALTFFIVKLEA